MFESVSLGSKFASSKETLIESNTYSDSIETHGAEFEENILVKFKLSLVTLQFLFFYRELSSIMRMLNPE